MKGMSSKSYVLQSCFHDSLLHLWWYSTCTAKIMEEANDRSLQRGRSEHGTLASIPELSPMEESHHSDVAQCRDRGIDTDLQLYGAARRQVDASPSAYITRKSCSYLS